jgi:predicted flap endonuclease-1-like 5' DNA nuclease
MKRFWMLAAALVLVAMLFVTVTPASAQGGRTVIGQPVTVESGDTVEGNLVALGGPITVERGARVEGDVVAVGGPVTIGGRVEGDIKAIGGPVSLRDSAVVEGDVVITGGPLRRSAGAVVKGEVIEGFRFGDLREFRFAVPPIPPVSPASPGVPVEVGSGAGFLSFMLALFKIGFKAVGVAIIALLVLIFIPQQTNTVAQMTADQPIASIGVGVLTMMVAALVIGVLTVTICGIPIALILGLVLLMALLYGWVALGFMVGKRLLAALDTGRPLPLIAGVVGALLLTLLSSVPCLGWLVGFAGGSWGLGAVVLSRGGTRGYPSLPGGWSPPSSAPSPASAATAVPPGAPEALPATERRRPAARPTAQAEASAEGLDNLQAIMGIGPVYERMLREAGIRTYSDLASRSSQTLVEAVSGPDVIPVSVEAAQRWIEEARRLAEEHN